MREALTTVAEIAGGLLIAAGVALLSVPAALIVAGVLLIGLSWLESR